MPNAVVNCGCDRMISRTAGHAAIGGALFECGERPIEVVGRTDQLLRIVGVGVHALVGICRAGHIAERLEPPARVGVERNALLRRAAGRKLRHVVAKQRLERARPLGIPREEVRRLAGIGREVVELGHRQIDQLERPR